MIAPEGTCPVPSALRKIENTTAILTKLVPVMNAKGKRESAANTKSEAKGCDMIEPVNCADPTVVHSVVTNAP